MGFSISQEQYDRYKRWHDVQQELQRKFKDFYNLDFMGDSRMKGLMTAPEFRGDGPIENWKRCNNTQARKILEQLGSGRIDRADVLAWIKSPVGRI